MRLQSKCKARCWKASILPLIRNLLRGRLLGRLRLAWKRDCVAGRDVNREAGEARRGHGCAVPLQGQETNRRRAQHAARLQRKDAAWGLGVAEATPHNCY